MPTLQRKRSIRFGRKGWKSSSPSNCMKIPHVAGRPKEVDLTKRTAQSIFPTNYRNYVRKPINYQGEKNVQTINFRHRIAAHDLLDDPGSLPARRHFSDPAY